MLIERNTFKYNTFLYKYNFEKFPGKFNIFLKPFYVINLGIDSVIIMIHYI